MAVSGRFKGAVRRCVRSSWVRSMSIFYPRDTSKHPGYDADVSQNVLHKGQPISDFTTDRIIYKHSYLLDKLFLRLCWSGSVGGIIMGLSRYEMLNILPLSEALSTPSWNALAIIFAALGFKGYNTSKKYIREICLLAEGKSVRIVRIDRFGRKISEKVPINRLDMTPHHWIKAHAKDFYSLQFKRDPRNPETFYLEPQDDLRISRDPSSAEFLDKKALQYVFGRYLCELGPERQ
ncbi:hypothetical protein AAMO2058_000647700 [Amorphochlora amoebiformis]